MTAPPAGTPTTAVTPNESGAVATDAAASVPPAAIVINPEPIEAVPTIFVYDQNGKRTKIFLAGEKVIDCGEKVVPLVEKLLK